jgi:hypothetical protein
MNSVKSNELDREGPSLWLLASSPAIWAAHFLLSYISGAVWCGKIVDKNSDLFPIQAGIVGFALLALVGIGLIGRRGWQMHRQGNAKLPHDEDTREDQHRFLGFATALLSGLSAIATIYAAVSIVFLRTCW